MTEYSTQPNSHRTAQAIRVALGSNLLARCPIHPDVLIAIIDASDVPVQPDPELQATIVAVIDATPHFCPLCVNADPE